MQTEFKTEKIEVNAHTLDEAFQFMLSKIYADEELIEQISKGKCNIVIEGFDHYTGKWTLVLNGIVEFKYHDEVILWNTKKY